MRVLSPTLWKEEVDWLSSVTGLSSGSFYTVSVTGYSTHTGQPTTITHNQPPQQKEAGKKSKLRKLATPSPESGQTQENHCPTL